MKKTIVMAIFIILIMSFGGYYYFNKLIKNTEQEIVNIKQKPISEKKESIYQNRNYDDKIKRLDSLLTDDSYSNEQKSKIAIVKSFAYLGKRDAESLKKSIQGFKEIIANKYYPTKNKGLAYEKLANMYWRTGGNVNVIKDVFSDDFKQYAVIEGDKINVFKSTINLYKKAFELYPNARSAIEIAYYYAQLKDINNTKKWLDIAEKNENKGKNPTGYFYKLYLVQTNLTLLDKDFKADLDKTFEQAYQGSLDPVTKTENYNYYNSQGIPFLYMFKIIYLIESDKEKNKKEIKNLIEKIVEFVKGDPKPEYNEYIYFLKRQSYKDELDLVGKYLPEMASYSDNLKTLLNEYGFNLKK